MLQKWKELMPYLLFRFSASVAFFGSLLRSGGSLLRASSPSDFGHVGMGLLGYGG